jgi:hypothetical protein
MYRVIMCAAVGAFCINTASADETLKSRTVYYTTSVQSQPAPDADGHVISLVASTGLGSYPDGSIAVVNVLASTDYVKGSGTFVSYSTVTFRDGSALFTKSNATGTTDGTKASLKGTMTILGGKGRYEGAKGDGSFTGERIAGLPTAGAMIYTDEVLNIKK